MATAQATAEDDLGFPPKGSLKRFSFPRLLREIGRNRLTGSLYLLSGQTKKVVFFEKGQPVFVRSNVLAECLGQVLAEVGLITQEQCEQTLEAIRRTGKKQGELLVEMGILSEGNLRYGLEAQLRTKLFEIFSWEDGRYQFKAGESDQQFHIRVDRPAESVIVEAIQDRYSEDRALKALEPYLDKYPVPRKAGGEGLDLLPEEQYFLACLDGSKTFGEVLSRPPEPSAPTPAALLYGLLQASVVQVSDRAKPAKTPPAAPKIGLPPGSDDDYRPMFAAVTNITEYEDTPLPGELPKAQEPLGDHASDFDDVDGDELPSRIEVDEELVAAEPESVDETFDEEIELIEEDAVVVVDDEELVPDDDLAVDLADLDKLGDFPALSMPLAAAGAARPAAGAARPAPGAAQPTASATRPSAGAARPNAGAARPSASAAARPTAGAARPTAVATPAEFPADPSATAEDDLLDLEELDDIDLGGDVASSAPHWSGTDSTLPTEGGESPEMLGAMRFNEGEMALGAGDYSDAVRLLEEAYENGFDVAELHAMLAYGRFMSSDMDEGIAQHAFELLDYAEEMDPSLDIVHAYRGAIHRAMGEPARARASLERALEMNPYCELAIQIMDSLG